MVCMIASYCLYTWQVPRDDPGSSFVDNSPSALLPPFLSDLW